MPSGFLMSMLRYFLGGLYLYVMLHAASVVMIAEERWDRGIFWDTRLPDKFVYYDAVFVETAGEVWVLCMISSVLVSIYAAYGLGSQGPDWNREKPAFHKICMCIPYMMTFLGCCIFSIGLLTRQIFMQELNHASMNLYAKLILALLFKILIMVNMTSAWLRAYAKLTDIIAKWNREHVSNLGFDEILNILFYN